MKNIAIYAGTFDPVTFGHVDLIERALQVFDRVIVAVAASEKKHPMFTLAERVSMCEHVLKKYDGVTVQGFSSLLTDFAHEQGANVILRGLRAVSDFDYEFQLASMNRRIAPDLETIFLMPDEHFSYISSRLVREISLLGGNVKDFVPEIVLTALQNKVRG
jgi:pantetheine-phosphate adenylyltransferase